MLTEEQKEQVLTYVRNEQYSELSFLIFNVVFKDSILAPLKDDFLKTKLTDLMEKKARTQTPPTSTDEFIIGSIMNDIGTWSYGLHSGIITKESFK